MEFDIPPVSRELEAPLRLKINEKTKPLGALGRLEALALQIGLVQNTLDPRLERPTIAVFAGDHGITRENVSAYPSEVTAQMVFNFLAGGAAINVFAAQNGIDLKIIDAGVACELSAGPELIDAKIAHGTKSFLGEAAMSRDQCEQAIRAGAKLVADWRADGCNVIGFGEMGIGNTSSAALITSILGQLPLERCVGAGAGLDDPGVAHKRQVLQRARARVGAETGPALEVLAQFGGFEIAMIAGGMLSAAASGMLILVDGFIATSAYLVARELNSNVHEYCVFTHCSAEQGHQPVLAKLGVEPLLDMRMRLGEGTGAALAYPIVRAAVSFLNEMSSFSEAQVSTKK